MPVIEKKFDFKARGIVFTMLLAFFSKSVFLQGSYEIYKYQVQNKRITSSKFDGKFKGKDTSYATLMEMTTIIDRYVFKDLNYIFTLDTIRESYIQFTDAIAQKVRKVPLNQLITDREKFKFYVYDIKRKIVCELNDEACYKISFSPGDTLVTWINKKTASILKGKFTLEVTRKIPSLVPPFCYVFERLYALKIKSPKLSIYFDKIIYLPEIPFKDQWNQLKEKIKNVNDKNVPNKDFNEYFE